MWMSSSSVRNGNVPASSSARTVSRPFTIASRSSAVSRPARGTAGDVETAPDERLVRADDPGRYDRHARPQRQERDAGQTGLEPATRAERSLREDPDDAPEGQRFERSPQRAHVRSLQVDRDGAQVAVEQGMERGRPPDAGHDEKRDRRGDGDDAEGAG